MSGQPGYYDYQRFSLALMLCTLVLSIVPEGLDFSSHEFGDDYAGGSILRRVQWLPIFAMAFYMVWRKRLTAWLFLRDINPFFLAFTAYIFASMLWSPDPALTFRRLVQVGGAILVVMAYEVTPFHIHRFARALRAGLGFVLVASFVAVIALPSIGVMSEPPHVGAWRGLAQHKNHMGVVAAIGLLAWLHGWLSRDTGTWRMLGMVTIAILFLIKGRSSTALALAGVGVMTVYWLMRPPVVMRYWIMTTVIMVAVLLVCATYVFVLTTGSLPSWSGVVGPIAEFFGKDATLTGRDVLWTFVWANFERQPMLGYGYGAFWLGDVGPSGELAQILGWIAFQAHNGYLDILNETGVIGFWLFSMYLITHFCQIARLYSVDRGNATLHMVLLLIVMVGNWTESFFFRPMTFIFLLLTWSTLTVDRQLSVIRAVGQREHQLGLSRQRQARGDESDDFRLPDDPPENTSSDAGSANEAPPHGGR